MGILADSNITKRALALALKELMEIKPFASISVGDICGKCEMNRKSFYYHFKDKYDLVNWIYYTEFIAVMEQRDYQNGWELLEDLCSYFYDNRQFYRKMFRVEGQNSFSEYFKEMVMSIISKDIEGAFLEEDFSEFFVSCFADSFVSTCTCWLLQRECIPAQEFARMMKTCLVGTSKKILQGQTNTTACAKEEHR